jgi:hypothetical protein
MQRLNAEALLVIRQVWRPVTVYLLICAAQQQQLATAEAYHQPVQL